MGQNKSIAASRLENPSAKHRATLYYFGGRGLADQIRWMLAVSEIEFIQKTISDRSRFLKMTEGQLPFGQLPLLQIDGLEIVQSQAAVRFLAKRANLVGYTEEEALKCDIIAESVRDLISLAASAPFKRCNSVEEGTKHINLMKSKFQYISSRYEEILKTNYIDINSEELTGYLVGKSLTYADVLVTHITTWFVEECGSSIVEDTPLLVELQNKIISLPGIQNFIKSKNFYSIGDIQFVQQVNTVLDRDIK